jgi:hypothetical protein
MTLFRQKCFKSFIYITAGVSVNFVFCVFELENLIKRFEFNIDVKDICCFYNFDFASKIKKNASKVCYKF